MSAEIRTCILCSKNKPISDFSLEHIWPQALGGQKLDDIWKTRSLCITCNNDCGLNVDGEFLRSFFGKAERETARNQINSDHELVYLGQIGGITHPEGRTLEYWAFPERITVFVSAPNESFSHLASGDPRKKNEIRVYLETDGNDLSKYKGTAVKLIATFEKSKLFFINRNNGDIVPKTLGDEIEAVHDRDALQETYNYVAKHQQLQTSIPFRVSYGNRFLAKTALSLASALLGDDFARSEYGSWLRQAVFERDEAKRAVIPVRGSGYFGQSSTDSRAEIFHRPGNWTLYLAIVDGDLTLTIATPTKKLLTIVVVPQFPQAHGKYETLLEGQLWFVSAAPANAEGPISLGAFLNNWIGPKT